MKMDDLGGNPLFFGNTQMASLPINNHEIGTVYPLNPIDKFSFQLRPLEAFTESCGSLVVLIHRGVKLQ